MFRVVQCCKHLVGEGLKLEVRAAVGRMMDMHLRGGERSLENNYAPLCGCYPLKLLEKGQVQEGLLTRVVMKGVEEVSRTPECGR